MAQIRPIGTLASVFLDADDGRDDVSDYRAVPRSDKGNAGYSDKGGRGTWTARDDAFPDPEGLKRFPGYGADEAALRQGFVTAEPNEDPAYDLINYKDRSSQPKRVNEDFGNTSMLPADYAFRRSNRLARGLLTRNHLPTER